MAPLAGEVPRVTVEGLPMAAAGADRIREGEISAEPLELSRLAPHQAPPLGRMVADLEEPPVHRNVAPIDVEDDDLTRGYAHDGIPCTATQKVRASFSDARPAPGLESCGTDGTRWVGHPT
jgi:hypothetical protein